MTESIDPAVAVVDATTDQPPTSTNVDMSAFHRDDFDINSFVIDARKRIPIKALADQLASYHHELQGSVVELINREYAAFVSLSSSLVGVDDEADDVVKFIEESISEIKRVKSGIDAELEELQHRLHLRESVGNTMGLLQKLLSIASAVHKTEALLGVEGSSQQLAGLSVASPQKADQRGGQGDAAEDDAEEAEKLVERVATEYSQLQFHVRQCTNHPFVVRLQPRIDNITRRLQNQLSSTFRDALQSGDYARLRSALRTFGTIGRLGDIEVLFLREKVEPFIAETVTADCVRPPGQGLDALYDKIIEFVEDECALILDAAEACGLTHLDIPVNSIFPPVANALMKHLSFIFAPGIPNAFHKNYRLSLNFLHRFELLCRNVNSVSRLREHDAYLSFKKRWSLPVYFQLRFQSIAGALEMTIADPSFDATEMLGFKSEVAQPSGHVWQGDFHTSAAKAMASALDRCWADDVYLEELSHRFWKLSLLLMARLLSHIETMASDESRRQQVVQALSDADRIAKGLPRYFEQVMWSKLSRHDVNMQGLKEKLHHAVEEFEPKVAELSEQCLRNFVSEYADKACSVLGKMKDVKTKYQIKGESAPSGPSTEMQQVRNLLGDICDGYRSVVSVDQLKTMTRLFLEQTNDAAISQAEDALEQVKKTIPLLKRKKGQDVVLEGAENARQQLLLDLRDLKSMAVEQLDEDGLQQVTEGLDTCIQSIQDTDLASL